MGQKYSGRLKGIKCPRRVEHLGFVIMNLRDQLNNYTRRPTFIG